MGWKVATRAADEEYLGQRCSHEGKEWNNRQDAQTFARKKQ